MNTFGVPDDVLGALVRAESGGNPNAVSPKGAIGLTQVMPATAREMGYDPEALRHDPRMQLEAGARYLSEQYKRFGNWPAAFAAFNAGPGRVARGGKLPQETQSYLSRIMNWLSPQSAEAGELPVTGVPPGFFNNPPPRNAPESMPVEGVKPQAGPPAPPVQLPEAGMLNYGNLSPAQIQVFKNLPPEEQTKFLSRDIVDPLGPAYRKNIGEPVAAWLAKKGHPWLSAAFPQNLTDVVLLATSLLPPAVLEAGPEQAARLGIPAGTQLPKLLRGMRRAYRPALAGYTAYKEAQHEGLPRPGVKAAEGVGGAVLGAGIEAGGNFLARQPESFAMVRQAVRDTADWGRHLRSLFNFLPNMTTASDFSSTFVGVTGENMARDTLNQAVRSAQAVVPGGRGWAQNFIDGSGRITGNMNATFEDSVRNLRFLEDRAAVLQRQGNRFLGDIYHQQADHVRGLIARRLERISPGMGDGFEAAFNDYRAVKDISKVFRRSPNKLLNPDNTLNMSAIDDALVRDRAGLERAGVDVDNLYDVVRRHAPPGMRDVPGEAGHGGIRLHLFGPVYHYAFGRSGRFVGEHAIGVAPWVSPLARLTFQEFMDTVTQQPGSDDMGGEVEPPPQ